jgi:hypothetical protein
MFDIKALENDQIYKWNVTKLNFLKFLSKFLFFHLFLRRDHETHRKRIDDIVASRKKKIKDPVLLEHIKQVHQAKEQSRRMIQTGKKSSNKF